MNKKNWLSGFVSVFKGTIIEVLQKTSNSKTREVARRAPGVRIIAITNDNEFIISREHREYLEKEIDDRLPGGKVVDTLFEYHALIAKGNFTADIEAAAKRELLEETGIAAKTVKLFAVSNSGGTIDWDLYYFVMTDLSFGEARPEDDEKIEVLKLSLKDTIDLVLFKSMSEDRSRMILLDYLLEHHPVEVSDRIIEINTNDA